MMMMRRSHSRDRNRGERRPPIGVTRKMKNVDALEGWELAAAVEHEAMQSAIGWILMPDGERKPVILSRLTIRPGNNLVVQLKWVPRYSTELAHAAKLEQRMEELGLTARYEQALLGTTRTPRNICRAALVAVRVARAMGGCKISAA